MTEHGICAKCKKSVGCPYADDRITGCKNFVLEPELKLTNEESLRQCNTEQLAEYLWRSKKSYWSPYLEDTDKMEIEDMLWWLKQLHSEVADDKTM